MSVGPEKYSMGYNVEPCRVTALECFAALAGFELGSPGFERIRLSNCATGTHLGGGEALGHVDDLENVIPCPCP